MAEDLPPNPDLDHLRKQAKSLLRAYRNDEPHAVAQLNVLRLKRLPRLSDAKHAIALRYGFESWSRLKDHVESAVAPTEALLQEAKAAFLRDDAAAFGKLLKKHPALQKRINEPVADFDSPLINHVRSREMLDVLLDYGADVNARSRWWAGGFGLLDCAEPELADYAVRRGATMTIHAAARLGHVDQIRALVADNPGLIRARGGDGQTALHFASTIEVAEWLLHHGAEIDAPDIDHESTPAQYMVRTRPDVARYLIRRGCKTDLLMAAALGDADLVAKHLHEDPESIRIRVSDEYFPMVDSGRGGTIYQWELGWYVSACQVARSFGHHEVFEQLMAQSPSEEKLLNACWLHDEAMVRSLLAENPRLADALPAAGRRHVAHAARSNDNTAAQLMLHAGIPAKGTYSQHHATALHWAAFHGNAGLVRLILRHSPDLEDVDNEFSSTPLGWVIHGSENGWYRGAGDYGTTVTILLDAGASPPPELSGSSEVRAALRHGRLRS